jgi:hypothetical protein
MAKISSAMLMSPKVRLSTVTVHICGTHEFAVADQVEAVYDAVAAKRAPGHGRDGYYFVANGDVAFSEVVAIVETRAGARRVFTQAELTAYFPNVRFSIMHTFHILTLMICSRLCRTSLAIMEGATRRGRASWGGSR